MEMGMGGILRTLSFILACCLWSNFVFAEKLALIVGIDRYEHLPQLQKANGDSQAFSETFRAAGYQTIRINDVSREIFWREWSRFVKRIHAGDEIAFVFSGHGLEIDGFNYLLASDAPKPGRDESIVRENAIQVTRLLAELQKSTPRVSFVVLDACRNNPYTTRGTRAFGGSRGLAPMDAPAGAFVMYSAGAGEEALDRLSNGDQELTSVYTRSLLPLLKQPNLRIQDVAVQVREDVGALAASIHHAQHPAYYDDLRGKFCFSGCSEGGVTTVTVTNSSKKQSSVTERLPEKLDNCSAHNPKLSCLWKAN